jgi:hypothetical protein
MTVKAAQIRRQLEGQPRKLRREAFDFNGIGAGRRFRSDAKFAQTNVGKQGADAGWAVGRHRRSPSRPPLGWRRCVRTDKHKTVVRCHQKSVTSAVHEETVGDSLCHPSKQQRQFASLGVQSLRHGNHTHIRVKYNAAREQSPNKTVKWNKAHIYETINMQNVATKTDVGCIVGAIAYASRRSARPVIVHASLWQAIRGRPVCTVV